MTDIPYLDITGIHKIKKGLDDYMKDHMTTTSLITYHNDKKIKAKYIKRVKAHRLADELIKGKGWTGSKGCAVGCTLNKYEHAAYETELGIPLAIARLEDVIFEGLPQKESQEWPERFLKAVPIGADLSMVWPKFTLWVLKEVLQYARPQGKVAIQTVIGLFERWVAGDKPSRDEFIKARKNAAADAAAAYAAAATADAAADAYAAAATAYADADAYATAATATAATAYAADAAAATAYADAATAYADAAAYAAAYAARKKFWLKAADKLIEIIKEGK